MADKVRLSDIASELGLSTATVSYVLHGKTGMVSERTANRVRQALEERGYLPRAAEVLLAENPAKIVGVVINDHEKYEAHILEDAFIASALNALSAETAKRGLQMMVKAVHDLDEIVSFATMWNLEGLVLIGFCGAEFWMIPMAKGERLAFYEERLPALTAFTAIFAVSDYYAVELCHFLSGHGIAVPEEVSVCGFDDTPLCAMVYPALTSVRQDTAARAKCALDALRRLRAGETVELSVTLPTKLIVRGSTRSCGMTLTTEEAD